MAIFSRVIRNTLCAIALLGVSTFNTASAESLFEGCPSGPIIQRFIELSKSGKSDLPGTDQFDCRAH